MLEGAARVLSGRETLTPVQLPPHFGITGRTVLVRSFACWLAIMATAAWVSAGEPEKRKFDVPADLAEKSLRVFSVQSGSEVLFSSDAASGVRTNAIKGEFLPGEAVKKMLTGTTLYVRDERDGVFRIAATPRPKAPGAALNPDPNDRPGEAKSGARSRDPPPGTSSTAQPNQLQTSQPQHNESPPVKNQYFFALIAAWLVAGPATYAQTASAPANDKTVSLSPFEVKTDRETGYETVNANSITGLRTAIKDLPLSVEIMNQRFLDDVAVTSGFGALRNFAAGVGQPGVTPGGTGQLSGDTVDIFNSTVRGFKVGESRMDGVVLSSVGMYDRFGIDRVELIRGPQSLLYGAAGPGGISNMQSKQAWFGKRSYQFRARTDDQGSRRGEIDTNQSLGDRASVRLAAVQSRDEFWRENLGNKTNGFYGQFAIRPWDRLTLRLSANHLKQDSIKGAAGVLINDPTSPLSNQRLRLLVADGSAGLLLNGKLNWENVDSLYGDRNLDGNTGDYLNATADIGLTSWLSVRLSAADSDLDIVTDGLTAQSNLLPPTRTPLNPTGKWAFGGRPYGVNFGVQSRGLRAQAVATFDVWKGRLKNSLTFGAEERTDWTVRIVGNFYQMGANGEPVVDRAQINNANAGRTLIPVAYWSVEDSLRGVWGSKTDQYVVNGVTYRLADTALRGVVPATASNPLGMNNNAGGYSLTRAVSKGEFAALTTDWFDHTVTTLAGVRRNLYDSRTYQNGTAFKTQATSWNVGGVYHFNSRISPYVGVSDNFMPASPLHGTIDASPIPNSQGKGLEGGLKFDLPWWRVSGSLAAFRVKSVNEYVILTAAQQQAVDPVGINGRKVTWSTSGSIVVTRDKETNGHEVAFTSSPTREWRIRVSYSHIKAVGAQLITLPQFYNDEFYTDSAGGVLLSNKAPALVRSDPKNAISPMVPLTVAMMKDPNSPYFANLEPTSGRILNMKGGTLDSLGLINRSDGLTIGTGRTGLPIANNQLGFVSPLGGTVVIQQPGETITGFPADSVSSSAAYTFSEGRFLKGFELGTTLVGRRGVQGYFYNDSAGRRVLKRFPDQLQVQLMVGYSRKFGRMTWNTQINVSNAFNSISVVHLPDLGTGQMIDALRNADPRSIVWTNTFSF